MGNEKKGKLAGRRQNGRYPGSVLEEPESGVKDISAPTISLNL